MKPSRLAARNAGDPWPVHAHCASTPSPFRGIEGRACEPSTSTPAPPGSPSPPSSAPGTSSSTSRARACPSSSTATAARSTRPSTTRRSRCCASCSASPTTYHVLFLQGGARQQFAMVPMNFLPPGKSADYIVTGGWAEKALEEAQARRHARASPRTSRDAGQALHAHPDAGRAASSTRRPRYVHFTSNNTIFGDAVARPSPTPGKVPLVADMSIGLPVAADSTSRSFAPHLRRRAEEHRPHRRRGRHRPQGLHREGAQGHPEDLPLHARTPRTTRSTTRRPRSRIYLMRNVLAWMKEQGGLAGDREAEPREGRDALRRDRPDGGFYRGAGREGSRS